MDKSIIKETMLSLEGAALQSAREKFALLPAERLGPSFGLHLGPTLR
jgi:hypothetical protein